MKRQKWQSMIMTLKRNKLIHVTLLLFSTEEFSSRFDVYQFNLLFSSNFNMLFFHTFNVRARFLLILLSNFWQLLSRSRNYFLCNRISKQCNSRFFVIWSSFQISLDFRNGKQSKDGWKSLKISFKIKNSVYTDVSQYLSILDLTSVKKQWHRVLWSMVILYVIIFIMYDLDKMKVIPAISHFQYLFQLTIDDDA